MLKRRNRYLKQAKRLAPLMLLLGVSSCAGIAAYPESSLTPGARYVALGSSYAAGPGVTTPAEGTRNRCGRSSDNYAHQLARMRKLDLVDVTCGGATTAHILGAWNELPPQLDALTLDTALVTVTIGGNDVGYIGRLMANSCDPSVGSSAAAQAICSGMRRRAPAGAGRPAPPTDETWKRLASNMQNIAREVHRRSPHAHLVFVDYLTVISHQGTCPNAPLTPAAAAEARRLATRLAELTAKAARLTGAQVVSISKASRSHDACSQEPWVTGFVPSPGPNGFAPYHPNLDGMTEVARTLDRTIAKKRQSL